MLQPSSHHITATSTVSPEGTQDRNRTPAIKPSATAAHPAKTLRRLRMGKHKILAQIAEVHIKGMTSVSPDFCIFPYTEKG